MLRRVIPSAKLGVQNAGAFARLLPVDYAFHAVTSISVTWFGDSSSYSR